MMLRRPPRFLGIITAIIILGASALGTSMVRTHYDRLAYEDPVLFIGTVDHGGLSQSVSNLGYLLVREKRFWWLPGPKEIRHEITEQEYNRQRLVLERPYKRL